MELRVGIDYVCKFVQYIWPLLIVDKNKNNIKREKHMKTILRNKNSKKMNNRYFDVC